MIPIIVISFIAIFKRSDYFVQNMNCISNFFNQRISKIFPSSYILIFLLFNKHFNNIFFNPSLMVITDILSYIFRWAFEVKKEVDEENFLFIVIF